MSRLLLWESKTYVRLAPELSKISKVGLCNNIFCHWQRVSNSFKSICLWNSDLLCMQQKLYSPRNSPGQNTGAGGLSLLQGILPTQGSKPDLPHYRQILYQLSHQASPSTLEWVAYPFSNRSSNPGIELGSPEFQVDSFPAVNDKTDRKMKRNHYSQIFEFLVSSSHDTTQSLCTCLIGE